MSKNEYLITKLMKNEKHFPKILKKRIINYEFYASLQFYNWKKINYKKKIVS